MFGKIKDKLTRKEEKEVQSRVRVNLAVEQRTKDAMESQSQQSSETDRRGEVNAAAMRTVSSLGYILRDHAGVLFVGALMFIAEIFLAGPLYAVGTIIPSGAIFYFYTTKFYSVQYVHILLVKMKPMGKGETRSSPVVYGYYHIPTKLFRFINTEGVAPTIHDLRYGPGTFMAEDVIEDEYGFPVKIKFAWHQFPELEFLLKKEIYGTMKEYLERLQIISDKQTELGHFISIAAAREMTETRFRTINGAKLKQWDELEGEKQQILGEISKLLKDNKNLRDGGYSGYEGQEEEEDYAAETPEV